MLSTKSNNRAEKQCETRHKWSLVCYRDGAYNKRPDTFSRKFHNHVQNQSNHTYSETIIKQTYITDCMKINNTLWHALTCDGH